MPQGGTRRVEKALTAAMVRSVQEPGKYHDGGGLGLYLRVEQNGARFWVQRMTIRGKRRELGLGSPPLVPLAEAREMATANKKLARSGGDPLAEKRRARDANAGRLGAAAAQRIRCQGQQLGRSRSEWRRFAKSGRWDLVDWTLLPEEEMPELLRLLQMVVPMVRRGEGVEYRREHATARDRERLREWVDSGAYSSGMQRVGSSLAGVHPAEPSPRDSIRWSREAPIRRADGWLRLVSFAAAQLEQLAVFLEEEIPWEVQAEKLAIEKLTVAGIDYGGLRSTWVTEEPPGSQNLVQSAAGTGANLESLAEDDRFAFTALWHAANILKLCQDYGALLELILAPGDYFPEKDTVSSHMTEAAAIAYSVGLHAHALWGKDFETATLKGMAIPKNSKTGGDARAVQLVVSA
jgi:hypothetical protein